MKKRLISLLVMLVCLFVSMAMVAECEDLPEIRFLGAELGSTLDEVQEILGCEVREGNGWSYNSLTDILNLNEKEFMFYPAFITEEDTRASKVYLVNDESDGEVAGHPFDMRWIYFVRPVVDGALVEDDGQAVFYAAIYYFIENDVSPIREDLKNKLTELYGSPKGKGKHIIWKGQNNTEIHLIQNGDELRVNYVWLDAQKMIDEAYSVVEIEKVDISSNYGGL